MTATDAGVGVTMMIEEWIILVKVGEMMMELFMNMGLTTDEVGEVLYWMVNT